VPRLRPALLRRRRSGWLAATPVRRRSRRSWRMPVATGRIPHRGRLGLTLVLSPSRTLVRTTSTLARVTRVVNRVTPTVHLSTGPVVVSVTAPGGRAEAQETRRQVRRGPERSTAVERVHTRLRVERIHVERYLRTEILPVTQTPSPAGSRGAPGPPGRSMTLVRSAPAPAPVDTPSVADAFGSRPERVPDPLPATRVEQPAFMAPDVDTLATQVLDRIERRAIAQRERMGRV